MEEPHRPRSSRADRTRRVQPQARHPAGPWPSGRSRRTPRSVEGAMPFTPERLTLARQRRGMTKSRLAELAKVTPRAVSAYEKGDMSPSDATLARIADALSFPASFFAAPALEPVSVEGTSFRALSR